jgi:hypothetical protein
MMSLFKLENMSLNILKYINNIKKALGLAEEKLHSNEMEGIHKQMAFAFQQISKREQMVGKHLNNENISQVMRILMGKYFDLYVKIKFQNIWGLLGMYQANLDNDQYTNSLEVYIEINNLVMDLDHLYQAAKRHNVERIQFVDFQPFVNIPAQLNFLLSCIERSHARISNPALFEQQITISPANNRFGFYQPVSLEEATPEDDHSQERICVLIK